MCNRAVGGILSEPVLLCHSLLEPFEFFLLSRDGRSLSQITTVEVVTVVDSIIKAISMVF
jgi:hypothetical protein